MLHLLGLSVTNLQSVPLTAVRIHYVFIIRCYILTRQMKRYTPSEEPHDYVKTSPVAGAV
jgi:hypothetical protein